MTTSWIPVSSDNLQNWLQAGYSNYVTSNAASDSPGLLQSYDDWMNSYRKEYGLAPGSDLSQFMVSTNKSENSNWGGQLNRQVTPVGGGAPVYSNTWDNGGMITLGQIAATAAVLFGGSALAAGAGLGAGAGAGLSTEVGAGGVGTLGAGETGVTSLGSAWSPAGLGLTGTTAPSYGLEGLGSLASAGAGGGGVGTSIPSIGGGMTGGTDVGSIMSPGDYGLTSSWPTQGLGDFNTSLPGMVSGNTGSGGFDWGNLLQSYMNYNQNSNLIKAGQAADPFAQYRGMYGQMLAGLMQNPGSVTSLPGYQASLQAGEQALTRNLASQGLTGSGTAAQAITNYGGQFENQFYQQMLQTLGGFSGANINNANLSLAALVSGLSGRNNAVSSGLGGLLGGAGNLFGGSGGGGLFDSISGLFDEGSSLGGIGDAITSLFGI